MDTNTLSPTVAAATLFSTSVHAGNRNLGTGSKHLAVMKIWNAMMRGARNYCEEHGFATVHNLPHTGGATRPCENTGTLFTLDWYDNTKMCLPQSNQLYTEMLTQAVEGGRVCGEIQRFRKERKAAGRRLAQFILGQADIRECVSFLINRDNVI